MKAGNLNEGANARLLCGCKFRVVEKRPTELAVRVTRPCGEKHSRPPFTALRLSASATVNYDPILDALDY